MGDWGEESERRKTDFGRKMSVYFDTPREGKMNT
jgi:hypothetical protein